MIRPHGPARHTAVIPRLKRWTWWQFVLLFFLLAFFASAWSGAGFAGLTWEKLTDIPRQVSYVLTRMFPPSLERMGPVLTALVQTVEMAVMGNLLGLPFALLLALLAARNLSPHPVVYYAARGFVTLLRTVPALVYGIFMIAAVGLGPRAGVFTLALFTTGFCGRFFAEAMEEVKPEPVEALTAIGATRTGVLFSTIIPEALPSLINTMLFNLEHTVRASTVLGIVGAGGIGIELLVSFRTFHYDEACTILLSVFIMVILVERLCSVIRKRIL